VLEHIDDLFGPLNIETASQVIHLARRRAIADHRGFNHWTAPQRLAQKITFPVLSLHGQDNGLADPHTLCLMRQQFTRAGLPHLTALTPLGHCQTAREVHHTLQAHAATLQRAGQGSLLTWCVAGHGHQDGLIGRHAAQVNGVIAAFLARPALAEGAPA
jgi:cholesterol oxidase